MSGLRKLWMFTLMMAINGLLTPVLTNTPMGTWYRTPLAIGLVIYDVFTLVKLARS